MASRSVLDVLKGAAAWPLALIEASHDLMCVCSGGRIEYVNAGGARLLGLSSPDLAIGRPLVDFVHPDYVDISLDLLSYLAEQGESLPMKLAGRDGVDRDVEIRVWPLEGDPDALVVHGRDLTGRVAAARIQHQREQTLRDVIDAVPDPVLVVNREGDVQNCNRSTERLFGAPAAEVVGRPLIALFDAPDRLGAALARPGTRVMEGIGGLAVRVRSGEPLPVALTMTTLPRNQGDWSVVVIHPQTAAEASEPDTHRRKSQLGDSGFAESIFRNLEEAVLVTDSSFCVQAVNPAYTKITGYQTDEIVGRRPLFLEVIERDEKLLSRMWRGIAAHDAWEGEMWCRRKDGTEFAERVALSAIKDGAGHVIEYAAVMTDITQRKRDEERLRYQANYDVLTGLPNRTLLLERIKSAITAAKRDGSKAALLVIDLDGFKLVNDTFGHDVGDQLLQEASRRLTSCIRAGDTVARLGGDEFTILMSNLDHPRHAPIVADRVLEVLSKPFLLRGQESFLSGSIGIATFPDDGDTVGNLLRNADAAMYRAKEQGKANYQFYTADLNARVHERLALKNGLQQALNRGELSLHYQPKLSLHTGRVTGVEALMRWSNRDLGGVSAERFIPVLEETGLVVEVGAWALHQACLQNRKWEELGVPGICVAVNLSARQLRERDFVRILENALKETGAGPEAIAVEITESMLMSDSPHVVQTLGAIHEMGIEIDLDDFGTGYSSLSYLKRFPIDVIKIDRSFVSDIVSDADDAEIVRTIISMGHALNRRVIAEGVETPEQAAVLKSYGCDEMQGFLFSRPLPAEAATTFLRDAVRRQVVW